MVVAVCEFFLVTVVALLFITADIVAGGSGVTLV